MCVSCTLFLKTQAIILSVDDFIIIVRYWNYLYIYVNDEIFYEIIEIIKFYFVIKKCQLITVIKYTFRERTRKKSEVARVMTLFFGVWLQPVQAGKPYCLRQK